MNHKITKLIALILIITFMWQDLALLRSLCYSEKLCFLIRSSSFGGQVGGQAWGQTKGAVVLTGVRTNPNPLSPGQNFSLRSLAMEEKSQGRDFAAVETLRPQANAEKNNSDKTSSLPNLKEELARVQAEIAKTKKLGDEIFGKAQYKIADMGTHFQILVSANEAKGATLEEQTRDLLNDIMKFLQRHRLDQAAVVKQVVFMEDVSQKSICREIMPEYYGDVLPATSFVQQPPANGNLVAIQVFITTGQDTRVERVNDNLTIVHSDGVRWAHIAGIEPDEGIADTYEQAKNAFQKMRKLLIGNGFKFEHVLRTWLYERGIIDHDPDGSERYQNLNLAREDFFTTGGEDGGLIRFGKGFIVCDSDGNVIEGDIVLFPASTGIGMSGGTFVMECVAISTERKDVYIQFLENPEQTSTKAYIEDVLGKTTLGKRKARPLFSRGIGVVIGGSKTILVSGTASIRGSKTVHLGKISQQTDTTVENMGLVLGQAKADLKNIFQLTVYIKEREDYKRVKDIVDGIFPGIPRTYLIADVCRPELLVEIETVAYKPPRPANEASPHKQEIIRLPDELILADVLRPVAMKERR